MCPDGGGGKVHQHGVPHGDAEEPVVAHAEGLPADGLHPHGEARQHEYPVMLAKQMARDPPASTSLPRQPRKNMEIME